MPFCSHTEKWCVLGAVRWAVLTGEMDPCEYKNCALGIAARTVARLRGLELPEDASLRFMVALVGLSPTEEGDISEAAMMADKEWLAGQDPRLLDVLEAIPVYA